MPVILKYLMIFIPAAVLSCLTPNKALTGPFNDTTETVISDTLDTIYHTSYTLLYSEKHEQPYWVAYTLTKEEVYCTTSRTDDFRPDSLVPYESAQLSDYKYSGYDRGHLKPAADSKASIEEMSESFLLSNMSPQPHSFNAGIWVDMEDRVRDLAIEYDSVYVITGPVLKDGLQSIGENKVSVPEMYYKCIMRADDRNIALECYLVGVDDTGDIARYLVGMDSVEVVTGVELN